MKDERIVPAVHGRRAVEEDPPALIAFASWLQECNQATVLLERERDAENALSTFLRTAAWKALCKKCGSGLRVEAGVRTRHLERISIGAGVFIGAGTCLYGRFDGSCVIGDGTWVGPQGFYDARDFHVGNHVGLGPGVRVLGSEHTGHPADVPIISTNLRIAPVVIEDGADIGTGAVILPGVRIGAGAIVGAGAVVTHDVMPNSIVAGVPARLLRDRGE